MSSPISSNTDPTARNPERRDSALAGWIKAADVGNPGIGGAGVAHFLFALSGERR